MSVIVKDLLDSYEEMIRAISTLKNAIHEQEQIPRYLPTYKGDKENQLEAVVKSLTEIWYLDSGDELLGAGFICADQKTVAAVELLNNAKSAFKDSVDVIRGNDKKNSTLFTLADQHLDLDNRGEALRNAMRTARISRLDLLKCYRKIRVLPSSLESLSWTWARTHTKSEPISIEDAEKMARQRLSGQTLDLALSKLANAQAKGYSLRRFRELPNQLRANMVVNEGDHRKRSSMNISGIVIYPGDKLPKKLIWRDDPGPRKEYERLTRVDSQIDRSEPFIKALSIHLSEDKDN